MSGLSPQSQRQCHSFSGFDYTVNIAEEAKEESQTQKKYRKNGRNKPSNKNISNPRRAKRP